VLRCLGSSAQLGLNSARWCGRLVALLPEERELLLWQPEEQLLGVLRRQCESCFSVRASGAGCVGVVWQQGSRCLGGILSCGYCDGSSPSRSHRPVSGRRCSEAALQAMSKLCLASFLLAATG